MVGALPTGLPPVSIPSMTPLLSGQLWVSAALLALVGMTETSSISRFVARRIGQRSDPGREAVGQGLANVAVAFVGGYPVCASLSGTSVNLAGGARGPGSIYVFTALALMVALCLGPLFAYLPASRSPRSSSWRSRASSTSGASWLCAARTGSTLWWRSPRSG
jgi:sulfate permease, SulP family